MATETVVSSASLSDFQSNPRQVKLQLTTRNADISLREKTGPILVNTRNPKAKFQKQRAALIVG